MDGSVDNLAFGRIFSIGECLVLNQLQPLPSIERKLVIVADESDAVAQGVGDNDMVGCAVYCSTAIRTP